MKIINSYRQAIHTKYIGPTNHKGARVKAYGQAGAVTVGWDHALDTQGNHNRAVVAFLESFKWGGTWVNGGSADDVGFVYVEVPV